MKNYNTVFSAWRDDELVGLICVMDDGIMEAYIHYLLVKPDYQLKGVGKELLTRVKEYYNDYIKIVVIVPEKVSKSFEYSEFREKFIDDEECFNWIFSPSGIRYKLEHNNY